jgi:hypothetical protein
LKSPKDVLALGQAIVHELKLDDRGAVLERWLAHHLAELMSEADRAVGPAKAVAEQQAVDIILKLWVHRRALPEPVDPLGGYRNAIKVLGHLMPEADPWRRYHRHGSSEDLLHEMFETLSRIVLGGILLTQYRRTRSISEAELKALEDEETFLEAELGRWMKLLNIPPQSLKIEAKVDDPDSAEDAEYQNNPSESEYDDLTPEQQAARFESSVHSAIVANLERMKTDLDTLLSRWRNAAPKELDPDGDPVGDGSLGD